MSIHNVIMTSFGTIDFLKHDLKVSIWKSFLPYGIFFSDEAGFIGQYYTDINKIQEALKIPA